MIKLQAKNLGKREPLFLDHHFYFGAIAVLLAFLVALFIPEHSSHTKNVVGGKHNMGSNSQANNPDRGGSEDIEPLLQDTSV
ncbi:unnamed protein product [Ranitomeya imitator]|uniref:Uncharacterized protein n=1 Tax=Ranitomeya imitator TaxID=111125 RepID=A0ABN9L7M3_9NEOB|nr:unnamed protein product [Ranitomeya imitator]